MPIHVRTKMKLDNNGWEGQKGRAAKYSVNASSN